MKKLRTKHTFLFVMDALHEIDCPNDTSTSILMELKKRGHQVFSCEPKDLCLSGEGVTAKARAVSVNVKEGYRVLSEQTLALERLDCIFIRKDPPVDLEYLYLTHLLDRVHDRVLMVNRPSGIRNANEKLYPLEFNKWALPSLVTSNAEWILSFQEKIGSDLILKPLNRKGGEGIFLLKQKSRQRKLTAEKATRNGSETILAQKFLAEGVREGDKRILIWDGEILGVFGRIPKKGEFRANLSLGGRRKKAVLTNREKQMVSELKQDFQKKGFLFVGLDVIGGQLTEINVTSPAGITDMNYLHGTCLEQTLVDRLEKRLRSS